MPIITAESFVCHIASRESTESLAGYAKSCREIAAVMSPHMDVDIICDGGCANYLIMEFPSANYDLDISW